MSELSPEARNLIDGTRRADDPSESDRERVRARLTRELGAVALLSGAAAVTAHKAAVTSVVNTSGTAGTGAFKAAGTGIAATLTKVAVALGIAGAVGGTVWLNRPAEPNRSSAVHAPHSEAAAAPAPTAGPAPSGAGAPAVAPPSEAAATGVEPDAPDVRQPGLPTARRASVTGSGTAATGRKASGTRTSPPAPASTPDLSAELSYLERAQRALRTGDPAAALTAAREHAAAFPQGSLREERLGVEALARCALGHDGQEVMAAFARAVPNSPLLVRVRNACRVTEP